MHGSAEQGSGGRTVHAEHAVAAEDQPPAVQEAVPLDHQADLQRQQQLARREDFVALQLAEGNDPLSQQSRPRRQIITPDR